MKRYDFYSSRLGAPPTEEESADGAWVRFEDAESARKDAERFRWLRDNPWPPFLAAKVQLRHAILDAEVDACMAAALLARS